MAVTGVYDVTNATYASNITSQNHPERNQLLAWIEISVLTAIFILAVLGNGTVLLALWATSRKKKLSRMNLLIMHLSVADLFVAFFNVLPQLVWDITHIFKGGVFLCKSVTYLQVVAMYASSYVLISTAIDRYIALCHPITSHTWTNQRTHLMVAIAWCVSFILSTPQLFIFGYRQVSPGVYNCWAVFDPMWTMLLYITCFTVAIYIIPTIILVFTYGRICYVVWEASAIQQRSMKEGKRQNGKPWTSANGDCLDTSDANKPLTSQCQPRVHMRTMTSSKIKTVKLTLTVIVCYFLCWSPFFICQMWAAWDINAPFQGAVMVIIMLLASLNSCTNPWIYLFFTGGLSATLRRAKSANDSRRYSVSFSNGRTEVSRTEGSFVERGENGRLDYGKREVNSMERERPDMSSHLTRL